MITTDLVRSTRTHARHLAVAAAGSLVLAALGAAAAPMAHAAAHPDSTQTATWTKQLPVSHPTGRYGAAMAYDAATGTVVLFGGYDKSGKYLNDTWTWDGTTWTQQHPVTSPPARDDAQMAYDTATGTVVLFSGYNGNTIDDTWTWDGTTWTQQHPMDLPSGGQMTMASDPAAGDVVLLASDDTFAWNGTDWTMVSGRPQTHPVARSMSVMDYDAATSTDVLFGGFNTTNKPPYLSDTWTWDGTSWTKQHPASHPIGRDEAVMAYDATTSTEVLFGGAKNGNTPLSDTWTWDGTTWTKQSPAAHPTARTGAAAAYDAATGTVVLFGGSGFLSDTWTWG